MQGLLTYGKQNEAYLAGQVVDGVKWITNGRYLARERYLNLRPAELRLSIEEKGIWSRTDRGPPTEDSTRKLISGVPAEDRIDAKLTDVSIDLGDLACRIIVPADGEGFGVMVQEQYLCGPFLLFHVWISKVNPLAPVTFHVGDEIHAILMPMRVSGEVLSELGLVAAAMYRAEELVEKQASERREEAAENIRLEEIGPGVEIE